VRARKLVLVGLVAVMLLGLAACGDDGGDDDNLLGGSQTADLVVGDEHPFYEPTSLEMPLNREITFTVFNEGDEVHNITIPGFAIDMDVQPKANISITLPAISEAPRDGFYSLYCKYHQSDGEAMRINISR
jgi:plastocyanin